MIAKISKTAKCVRRPRARNAPERHAETFGFALGVDGRAVHDRYRPHHATGYALQTGRIEKVHAV